MDRDRMSVATAIVLVVTCAVISGCGTPRPIRNPVPIRNPAVDWHNEGLAYHGAGNYEDAVKCYERALEYDSSYLGTWLNLGLALRMLRRYEEALECYDNALSVEPDNARIWYDKGLALGGLGRWEEALECYDRALEIDPHSWGPWFNKGLALGSLGRWEGALECNERALEINPYSWEAWLNKGTALGGLGRWEEALECYGRALEITPDEPKAWHAKGMALEELGRRDEALQARGRAEELRTAVALAVDSSGAGGASSAAEVEPEDSALSAGEVRVFQGIDFVWVPPGKFTMGSPPDEAGRDSWEGPRHEITLSKGFWLGKYEVTAGQFLEFLEATGKDSGVNFGDYCPVKKSRSGYSLRGEYVSLVVDLPMVEVSWHGAVAFCEWLSSQGEGKYRLPTEAEWEYACRAGTTTAFSFGDDESDLDYYGCYYWLYYDDYYEYEHEYDPEPTEMVGSKKPNAWGLYDMHGNVWEWCGDWYGDYAGRSAADPTGPSYGRWRVARGGSCGDPADDCRSATRGANTPDSTSNYLGFRVVREAD